MSNICLIKDLRNTKPISILNIHNDMLQVRVEYIIYHITYPEEQSNIFTDEIINGILLHSYIISIYKQGQPVHKSKLSLHKYSESMIEGLPQLVMGILLHSYIISIFYIQTRTNCPQERSGCHKHSDRMIEVLPELVMGILLHNYSITIFYIQTRTTCP